VQRTSLVSFARLLRDRWDRRNCLSYENRLIPFEGETKMENLQQRNPK
jgi:hypothetical protein